MERQLTLAALCLLTAACVTVNVYFPASATERAADIFVKDVYGTQGEGAKPDAGGGSGDEPRGALDGGTSHVSIGSEFLNWIIPAARAQQPDINIATPGIAALKTAMEERHRTLASYYDAGAIGLSQDGLLTIRDAKAVPLKDRNTVNKLIADENRDRNRLYTEIATANGHPEWESQIRDIFARRWVGNAPGGWWFQTASGGWQQK